MDLTLDKDYSKNPNLLKSKNNNIFKENGRSISKEFNLHNIFKENPRSIERDFNSISKNSQEIESKNLAPKKKRSLDYSRAGLTVNKKKLTWK